MDRRQAAAERRRVLVERHQRAQRLKAAASRGSPIQIVLCAHGVPWTSCATCSTQRKDPI